MTNLDIGDLFMTLGFVAFGLTGWGMLDAAIRPDWAFTQAGQSRVLWIVLPGALYCFCLGWAAAIVYLVAIRPKVKRVQAHAGGPPAPYY